MSKAAWFERFETALAEFYDRAGREPSVIEEHWIASRCYKYEWDIDWEKEVGLPRQRTKPRHESDG